MHKLLTLATLSVLVLLSAWLAAPPRAEASFAVFTYLYHPMNSGSDIAYRLCGWHQNCNGDPNDPENSDADRYGLDWSSHASQSEPSNKTVWLTWKMLGGSSPSYVAWGETRFDTRPSGCEGLKTAVYRASDNYYLFDI